MWLKKKNKKKKIKTNATYAGKVFAVLRHRMKMNIGTKTKFAHNNINRTFSAIVVENCFSHVSAIML